MDLLISMLNVVVMIVILIHNGRLVWQRDRLLARNAELETQHWFRIVLHSFLCEELEKEVQPGVIHRARVDAAFRAQESFQQFMEEKNDARVE